MVNDSPSSIADTWSANRPAAFTTTRAQIDSRSVLEQHPVAGAVSAREPGPRQQVSAGLLEAARERVHERLRFDHARVRREQRGDACRVRLAPPDALGIDDLEPLGAVGLPLRLERLEAGAFGVMQGDDELAAARVRHPVPPAERVELAGAFARTAAPSGTLRDSRGRRGSTPLLRVLVSMPGRGWRSSTHTSRPARAMAAADARPVTPPPTTTTSMVSIGGLTTARALPTRA